MFATVDSLCCLESLLSDCVGRSLCFPMSIIVSQKGVLLSCGSSLNWRSESINSGKCLGFFTSINDSFSRFSLSEWEGGSRSHRNSSSLAFNDFMTINYYSCCVSLSILLDYWITNDISFGLSCLCGDWSPAWDIGISKGFNLVVWGNCNDLEVGFNFTVTWRSERIRNSLNFYSRNDCYGSEFSDFNWLRAPWCSEVFLVW